MALRRTAESAARQVWRTHQAIERSGDVVCLACAGHPSWPCRPVLEVLPALDRVGFFD